MTFDPMSVEVTCVTLPKDHCVQVPWQYINVCGFSDQFCKIPHTYIHILHTYTYYIHTMYRMSDHIVSYWTQFRRDKKKTPSVRVLLLHFYDPRKGSAIFWYMCKLFTPLKCDINTILRSYICVSQGSLKRESVVAAILPSHMEASYCTSEFFHN